MRPFRLRPSRANDRPAAPGVVLLVLVVGLAGAVAGCTGSHEAIAGGEAAAPAALPAATVEAPVEAPVPIGAVTMPTAGEVTATWKSRPDYVRSLPDKWQSAYAFALARPDVLQWIPCYCGCDGLGHGSNLNCFFQARDGRNSFTFDEHGSYCDICVDTANLASAMLRDGKSMVEIRAAVDSTYGGGAAPGTDTPLPPA